MGILRVCPFVDYESGGPFACQHDRPCDGGLINIRVGAIMLKDGKFLMARNDRDDYLYSVGGRIQFAETAGEAVVREVEEETGVRMDVDRLGFIHENYFYGDVPGMNAGKRIYEFSFYMKVPEGFEPVGESRTDEGCVRETMVWVSPGDPRTLYSDFFRAKLTHPESTAKHFVTDERASSR